MEEDNKLKISEYLLACIDFEKTQSEDKLKEINDFIAKINFREYIPLKEKEILIMRIMSSISKDFDAPGAAAFVEMGKIGVGLLSYCTNLEVDVNFFNTLYHAYDLLHEFGLVGVVLEHCQKDYDVLVSMLDKSLSFDNFYRIIQTASLFDEESYDKWLETMNNLKTTLDQENLKALMATVNTEDEASKEVLQKLKEVAVQQVNDEMVHEQEKVYNAVKTLKKGEK